MKAIVLAALGSAALSASSAAPAAGAPRGVADPRAFVESVYRTGLSDGDDEAEPVYSRRLAALFAADRRDAGGEVGRIDFSYWTSSQEFEIRSVRVTEEPVERRADRRVIVADVDNMGQRVLNRFYFERTGGRWFLDDVRNVEAPGDGGWTLSLILKYGN
jgi:hypothetical protein